MISTTRANLGPLQMRPRLSRLSGAFDCVIFFMLMFLGAEAMTPWPFSRHCKLVASSQATRDRCCLLGPLTVATVLSGAPECRC